MRLNRIMISMLCGLLLVSHVAAQGTPSNERTEDTPLHDYYYPYHQPTGNKIIAGDGTFPQVQTVDIQIGVTPEWLVGFRNEIDSEMQQGWTVSTNGKTRFLYFDDTNALSDSRLVERQIRATTGDPADTLDLPPLLSHPVRVADGFVYVNASGDLVYMVDDTTQDTLALNLAPDVRPIINDAGEIAIYVDATDARYVHGIMGDDLEHAGLVIIRIDNAGLREVSRIHLPGDSVYEGLYPLWADVNGDETQDIITTVSNGSVGSQIRVYLRGDDAFTEVDGAAIGRPGRWQHQLAWAPFGVDGELELVDVLTPHIGGTVRFYRYDDSAGQMTIVAEQGGYTSHVIGSRNLEMAVAGDFNGDGIPEVVMPSQRRDIIAGIQRTENGADVVWQLPVNGTVISNLAALQTPTCLALAVGRADGTVRIWFSQ